MRHRGASGPSSDGDDYTQPGDLSGSCRPDAKERLIGNIVGSLKETSVRIHAVVTKKHASAAD
jgi:hypothetical protein